jgi:hypothetical protein
MIDYWRDQYRDYSKDLNRLWDRLRPGFAQLPPAAATSSIPSARPAVPTKTVDQIDLEMTSLYGAIRRNAEDYERDAERLRAARASGWLGYDEWRIKQLERDFHENQARLWAAKIETDLALRAKMQALLWDKEAVLRALQPQQPVSAPAPTPTPTQPAGVPRVPAVPTQAPVIWDELCILAKNLEKAVFEYNARTARRAPAGAVKSAENELKDAARELKEAMQGKFASREAMHAFFIWCVRMRGLRIDLRKWWSPETAIIPPIIVAVPTLPSPTAAAQIRMPYYYSAGGPR